ncbi:hypothetical protein HanPI659440_Chr16g0652561 [Helianthus annuus]|nr:hypothetical protein HanPI659440_Chr16g0652561 [Helianthus annuus]
MVMDERSGSTGLMVMNGGGEFVVVDVYGDDSGGGVLLVMGFGFCMWG